MEGKLNVQTENIFPVIKKFLYSDHEIFLRELISNAVDATQKLKTLSTRGEFKGELGDLTIDVKLDPKKKTLTVSDRGIGMTADEVEKYINQIAFSGVTDFMEKYKDSHEQLIGHFGLGFYSAFMVSDKVEIFTKSWKDEPAQHWSCEGNPEFSMEEDKKHTDRGTDIVHRRRLQGVPRRGHHPAAAEEILPLHARGHPLRRGERVGGQRDRL